MPFHQPIARFQWSGPQKRRFLPTKKGGPFSEETTLERVLIRCQFLSTDGGWQLQRLKATHGPKSSRSYLLHFVLGLQSRQRVGDLSFIHAT